MNTCTKDTKGQPKNGRLLIQLLQSDWLHRCDMFKSFQATSRERARHELHGYDQTLLVTQQSHVSDLAHCWKEFTVNPSLPTEGALTGLACLTWWFLTELHLLTELIKSTERFPCMIFLIQTSRMCDHSVVLGMQIPSKWTDRHMDNPQKATLGR